MQIYDLDGLRQYAIRFARELSARADRATIVTLSGDLGAGKTAFAQAIAKALGVGENVTSPTFVIEKIYRLKAPRAGGFERLVHIDAYRLESPHELEALGFNELLRNPKNLTLLEWPEKVPGLIPEDAIQVRFDIADDKRTISIDGIEREGRRQ